MLSVKLWKSQRSTTTGGRSILNHLFKLKYLCQKLFTKIREARINVNGSRDEHTSPDWLQLVRPHKEKKRVNIGIRPNSCHENSKMSIASKISKSIEKSLIVAYGVENCTLTITIGHWPYCKYNNHIYIYKP